MTVRRLGYRLAYRLLQVFWFFVSPTQQGVKCVLSHDGQILLVRHTYGPRQWDLPGGMVRRGEPPEATARREMHEELGVQPARFTDLGSVRAVLEHRHDAIDVFGAELATPSLTLQRAELEAARWFSPEELPRLRPLGERILRHALPLVVGD